MDNSENLNVLFISAEADPYVKVGGLGDVAGSLPSALHHYYNGLSQGKKLDIRVVIPYYGVIHNKNIPVQQVASFQIPSAKGKVHAVVYEALNTELKVYFIAGDPIHLEDPVYGTKSLADAEKFIFFSLACLKLPKALDWPVDIIHAQDWHTAITLHQLKETKKKDPFYSKTKSVITLHNLPFMGAGSELALEQFRIKPSKDSTLTDWGVFQPLPMGLSAADRIVAVSPTYAKEILTPGFSCDLHNFFKVNQNKLSGILNGLDVKFWDPKTDKYISENFSFNTLPKREKNKSALQAEMDFENNKEIPLLIMIGRMDPQKGVDLAIEALNATKHVPWQAVILGSGNMQLEQQCLSLEKENPGRVRAITGFNAELAHRLYAGADMILMPSRYEPCGLAQMIAMRYGCIPVARATGGLKDTIVDQDVNKNGTGFLFENADSTSLACSIATAVTWYHDTLEWKKIQQRAMKIDFSWDRSAKAYAELYNTLTSSAKI